MKTRWWWGTVAISFLVAAGAFAVGVNLGEDPPLDPAAEPEPVAATVALEQRALSEDVVVRADVVSRGTVTVAPPALPGGSTALVTRVDIRPGETVEPGRLLLSVADRPVIALSGAVPMYREIRPRDGGSDVLQLQKALIALGYELEEDGVFGRDTETAIRDLYTMAGVVMLHTGGQEQVDALEQELANARSGGSATEIARARSKLNDFAATVGNYIAKGEIAFLSSFPVRVLTTPSLGATWDGSEETAVLSLTGSELELVSLVPVEFESLVRIGTRGQVDLPNGESMEVTVMAIDPEPVVDEAGVRIRVSLEPDGSLDVSLNGENVKLTLLAEGPDGEVLAAPLTAVFTQTDGQQYLQRPDGSSVPVEVGFSAGGWVEIVGGEIEAGDEVVVGVGE